MAEKLYLLATITVFQANQKERYTFNLPVISNSSADWFSSVTVTDSLQKYLQMRLNSVDLVMITLSQVSKCLLEDEFQDVESNFVDLNQSESELTPWYTKEKEKCNTLA